MSWRSAWAMAMCIGVSLWGGPLARASSGDVDSHIAQAELYLKNGWLDDALDELQQALATPDC